MLKLIDTKVVKFVGATDLDGNFYDKFNKFLTLNGLLFILESDEQPGKHFFCFYANEPDSPKQRFFFCTPGRYLTEANMNIFISNHVYIFIEGDFISEADEYTLLVNAFT